MDIPALEAQERRLILKSFDEDRAIDLGMALVAIAREAKLPVLIDIRRPDHVLFQAALPGSALLNAHWVRRKSNTALTFQAASMLVALRMREKGRGMEFHGLSPDDYALSGGSVPIRVQGTGMVGVATVSGLPELEDHALVVQGLEAFI